MLFFQEEEKAAVDSLAKRVEEESLTFQGWTKQTICNPDLYRGEIALPLNPFQRPPNKNESCFLELERYKAFKCLLRDHHPFIETNSETQQDPKENWQTDIAHHCKEFGFQTEYGLSQSNFMTKKFSAEG